MKVSAIKSQKSTPLFKGSKNNMNQFYGEKNNTESESFKQSKKSAQTMCQIIAISSLLIASLMLIFHKNANPDTIKIKNQKGLTQ